MTHEDPSDFARLPQWLIKMAGTLIATLVAYLAFSFIENISRQNTQDMRIAELEKELVAVKVEQRVNSDYRVRHISEFEQMQEDVSSLLDGQRTIIRDVRRHAGNRNLNKPVGEDR